MQVCVIWNINTSTYSNSACRKKDVVKISDRCRPQLI